MAHVSLLTKFNINLNFREESAVMSIFNIIHVSQYLHIPIPNKCCTSRYSHYDLKGGSLSPMITSSIHDKCSHEARRHGRSHNEGITLVCRNQIVCPQSKRGQAVKLVSLVINKQSALTIRYLPNALDCPIGSFAQR